MKKSKFYIICVVCLLLVGIVIWIGMENRGTTPSNTVIKAQKPERQSYTLKKSNPAILIKLPGEIIADRQSDIYAKVSGFVQFLKVDIGSKVNKGDVLIELEAPELFAKASVLKAQIASQESVVSFSRSTFNRLLAASETQGAIAEDAIDKARTQKESDESRLTALQASYKEVQSLLDYLVIRAPFSGVITERNTDIGSLAVPSGKPLLVLQDKSNLRIRLAVAEKYTSYIHIGDTIRFTSQSQPGNTFIAKIVRRSNAIDSRLRSEEIEADFTNVHEALLPGMVVDATLSLKAESASFFVPESAVVDGNTGTYVMGIIDGKTKRISVNKGRKNKTLVEIYGNLSEGINILQHITEETKEGITF